MTSRRSGAICLGLSTGVLLGVSASPAAPADQPDPVSREIARHGREFPLLKPGKGPEGQPRQIRLALNRKPLIIQGERRDGFRFTTPATPSSFVWSFRVPHSVGAWSTFPLEHPDDNGKHGFTEFFKVKAEKNTMTRPAPGAKAADDEFIVQSIPKGRLLPRSTYIIWFMFDDDKPATVDIQFTFSPEIVTSERGIRQLLGAK